MNKREIALILVAGVTGMIIGVWYEYKRVVKQVLDTAAQTNANATT
jgi:hypothetical protein